MKFISYYYILNYVVFSSSILYERIFEKFQLEKVSSDNIELSDEDWTYRIFLLHAIHKNNLETASQLLIRSLVTTKQTKYNIKDLYVILSSLLILDRDKKLEIMKSLSKNVFDEMMSNSLYHKSIERLNYIFIDKFHDKKFTIEDLILSDGKSEKEIGKIVLYLFFTDKNFYKYLSYLEDSQHTVVTYILGKMYLEGIGVEKNLKKALKYFATGRKYSHSPSYVGIGRVYESKEFDDIGTAIKAYKVACEIDNNSEALVRLLILEKDSKYLEFLKESKYSLAKLAHIIYNDNADIDILTGQDYKMHVLLSHPLILDRIDEACDAFLDHNYTKAFLLFLYLSEFDYFLFKACAFNILNKHFTKVKLDESLKNRIYFELLNNSLSLHGYRYVQYLGECFYSGKGTQRSYKDAFACFKSIESKSSLAKLRLIEMYLSGKAVSRSLNTAKRILDESGFNFTLFYYIKTKIFFIRILDIVCFYIYATLVSEWFWQISLSIVIEILHQYC